MKTRCFLCLGAGDGIVGMLIAVLPPTFTPSCPLEVEIGGSPDDQYIHDTTVTACVVLRDVRTTPLSEQ